LIVVDFNYHMQGYKNTGQQQTPPIPVVAPRFDSRRIYTILVLAPLVYAVIRYLPPLAFSGMVVLAGALALYEFYRLCFSNRSRSWLTAIGLTGFAGLILGTHWPNSIGPTLLTTLLCVISVPVVSRAPLEQGLKDGAMTSFGVLYLGLTLSTLSMTRLLPQGEWLIFFLLLVTWASDTGAYYVGTLFGRHLLAPRISPKKTVEGLVGGLIGAIIVAYVARWWFLPDLSGLDCLILAFLLTVAGLWGDLTESAMKRSVGLKDSGGILPGHGGMLDRLDSLLFAAPAFYYYVTLVSRLRVSE
jgi:phosphatidate cytidylyltransferase